MMGFRGACHRGRGPMAQPLLHNPSRMPCNGFGSAQGACPMYIAGFVIPVPEDKMEAYRKWAENGAALFREYGCIEIVDGWEDNVPSGKLTDFRRAVDAKAGEKIVFSWQVWPGQAAPGAAGT